MKSNFLNVVLKSFLIFLITVLSATSIFAQTVNEVQIEEDSKTGIKICLFFGLLLFMLLAPAFKKREWPKLRKGYDYFTD